MNKLSTILLAIFILFILVSCKQEESEIYVFVENTPSIDENKKSIYRISENGEQVEHIYDLGERYLYWFSPNFRYLALVDGISNDNEPELVLTVTDVQSKEIIAQIPGLTPYRDRNSVVWDPTSSKILFDRTTTYTPGTRDWGIYDRHDQSLTLLPSDDLKLFPAWSTDGKQIAYVSQFCPADDDSCHIEPDYWNITITNLDATQIENVTDFENDSIPFLLGSGDGLFCDLQWSPDDQYIAFQNQCIRNGGTILEKHRVFMVNIEELTVSEVAKFEKPYAYAYHYDWSQTNDLLIGYSQIDYFMQADIDGFTTYSRGGLIVHDPKQSHQLQSAELLGFSGSSVRWAPDGTTFIAFTSEPIFEYPPSDGGGQLFGPGGTLLGNFDNTDGNLTIHPESNDLPFGYYNKHKAYWTEDGQMIAFASTGDYKTYKHEVTESDVFVYSMKDKDLNNLTESLEGISIPLGWATSDNE